MKTKILILTIGAALCANTVSAAGFEKVFGGAEYDRGVLASPTSDGGYIVVGVTKSFGAGGEDVYLVKADANGDEQWAKTYGGVDEDNGWSVLETADGFVLAGFTRSFGNGGFDFYLVKTDVDGEMVWSNTYGGAGKDRCWALTAGGDGGFLLAGETTSSGAGEEDCFVVKTDSHGEVVWSKTYGGEKGDRSFSVAAASDGGYVLAGQTYSEGAGDRDAYIIKIKAGGQMQWSKTFGGPASDVAHSVIATTDGAFMVTGYTTSFAEAGDDPYLIKIDERGDAKWTRVLSIDGINHTITGAQSGDGGYFLVGFSEYRAKRAKAALLVKVDSEGRLDWYRDVLRSRGGDSMGYTVQATADGGCVFAGHTTVGAAGDLDLLLVKIEDDAP